MQEYIIIFITLFILTMILKFIFGYNLKKIKNISENPELDKIADKYPNNIDICKAYLKKLNNETVKIEENEGANNCLYIAITNKILIANMRNSYTRIQTIAHECLHSVQDRKLLIFNFIYSNIYMLYFLVISGLALFKLLPYKLAFIAILIFMGLIYYMVRMYLENDAMIKARFLAKEYMEESKIVSDQENRKIIDGFDEINKLGIKCINYNIFYNIAMQVMLFTLICFVR